MSELAEECARRIQRVPRATKADLMAMIVLLMVEQIRLLEANAENREKALREWHAKPTNS